ncbi:MAG: FliM/FliN family flagellar motor C-terminal domain-containing protein [Pseudomonadota bacterium]
MRSVATVSSVKLNAVLHTITMEARELQALAPGQVIELPRSSLNKVHLRIDGDAAGPALSIGRLGNLEGHKAVKLSDPPDPEMQETVARSLPNLETRSPEP